MIWNRIRRAFAMLFGGGCHVGLHDWGLYRPGRIMWHRECKRCGVADMTATPAKLSECDVPYYENVYLPSRAAASPNCDGESDG